MKNPKPGTSVTEIYYRTTIAEDLLKIFLEDKWVSSASTVWEICESQIRECVAKRHNTRPLQNIWTTLKLKFTIYE